MCPDHPSTWVVSYKLPVDQQPVPVADDNGRIKTFATLRNACRYLYLHCDECRDADRIELRRVKG